MNDFSPFPPAGKRVLAARWSAFAVRTSYLGKWPRLQPKRFRMTWGHWPFFAFDLGFLHGYVGWKPITLLDTAFALPAGLDRTLPACELSVRIGAGSRS